MHRSRLQATNPNLSDIPLDMRIAEDVRETQNPTRPIHLYPQKADADSEPQVILEDWQEDA